MFLKKFIYLIFFIFIIIAFINSYDVRGVEELSYVIAIGLDKSEENGDYIKLTIQVGTTQSSENGGTSNLQAILYSIDAPSISNGLSILNTVVTNEINLSHCSAIIISEELAKDGVNPYFDNLINNIEIRPTANIIISNNTAEKFLEATSSSDDISAKYYTAFIGSAETTSYITKSSVSDFYSSLYSNEKEPTAIYGYTDGENIENIGIAIFDGEKYAGRLSGIETIIYNILTNNLETATISLLSPIDDSSILDVQISINKNTDISVYVDEAGQGYIDCKISLDGKILSAAENYDFTNSDDFEKLENAVKEKILYETNNYLEDITKNYKLDINGFYSYLKRNYLTSDEFKDLNWKKIFANCYYGANVEVKLTSNYLFSNM